MACVTQTTGRIINEQCDVCEHSLHWHNILYDAVNHVAPMPEDGHTPLTNQAIHATPGHLCPPPPTAARTCPD